MFVESLEVRALLSVSAIDAQVKVDRLAIKADLLKFRSDLVAAQSTLLADTAALKAAGLKHDEALAPLFKTLHQDVVTMQTQLRGDRLTESATVLKDESAIDIELLKIIADRGNATALQADRAALVGDRIQLQNDEIAGLDARLTTRQTDYTTLFNDLTNITTALSTDTSASTALTAAVTKFTGDRTTILDTLSGDLGKTMTDRMTLVTDLTTLEGEV